MDERWLYEQRTDDVAPFKVFLARFWTNVAVAVLVVGVALGLGMAGYAHFEGMSTIDAFLNAAMILSGMGPVSSLTTSAGKLFAGCYAMVSGLVVVAATGLVLAPVFHRMLHMFHAEDDE